MKLIFVNKDNANDHTEIIISDLGIVPRVGERVRTGYIPYPRVTDVVHDYKENQITIVIDGFADRILAE